MRLVTKVISISHAKFHCNRLTTVQNIQDYTSLPFWHTMYICKKGTHNDVHYQFRRNSFMTISNDNKI